MTGWVWDRFAAVAAAQSTQMAIRHGDIIVDFAGLLHSAETFAGTLDIATGDRVVLSAQNSAGFVAAVLAIWRRGAIPAVINADASLAHKAHSVTKTAARLAVTDGPQIPGVENLDLPALSAETSKGPVPPPTPLPEHGCTGASAASIIFTSGSTGPPKGVVQRAETLIDGADRIGTLLGLTSEDTILCPVPFSFDYGWGQLLSLTQCGIPLVLPEPRNGIGICAALETHAPTVLAAVPAVMADLVMGLAPIAQTHKGSLRLITNTGSKIPDNVFDLMAEHFPDAALSLNYGMTETYRTASLPPDMARTQRHSVGFGVPGVRLSIVDAQGAPLPQGEVGEVVHIGAGVFDSYWGEPEKTAAVRFMWTAPGEEEAHPAVQTGDFGYFDAQGRLCLTGRGDRQIKCMGVRLSLDEVEAALGEAPDLKELAVTATPHDMMGMMITAHVVPDIPDHDIKELKRSLNRFSRETLSPFMQPRAWDIRSALPRNVNGKINYLALMND